MKILITGVAGFIGFWTARKYLEEGYEILGVDNLEPHYDVRLKRYRLNKLLGYQKFRFEKRDIQYQKELEEVFRTYKPGIVIHLAAKAGVKKSIKDPQSYYQTNVIGLTNLLELAIKYDIKKFIFASSSSVYAGEKMPFKEDLPVNRPISPYAASKRAGELLCHVYNYLYGLNIAVLRFFTVYGPAGRPDMSLFRFMKSIYEGKPITVYGDGRQKRDFTYIDDIVEGIKLAVEKIKGYEIVNLGYGGEPVELMYGIKLLERYLNKKAIINFQPFNKADIKETRADIEKARRLLGWEPKIKIEEGIKYMVEWFLKEKPEFAI